MNESDNRMVMMVSAFAYCNCIAVRHRRVERIERVYRYNKKVNFYYVNVNLISPNWRVPSSKIPFNEGTRHLFQ